MGDTGMPFFPRTCRLVEANAMESPCPFRIRPVSRTACLRKALRRQRTADAELIRNKTGESMGEPRHSEAPSGMELQ